MPYACVCPHYHNADEFRESVRLFSKFLRLLRARSGSRQGRSHSCIGLRRASAFPSTITPGMPQVPEGGLRGFWHPLSGPLRSFESLHASPCRWANLIARRCKNQLSSHRRCGSGIRDRLRGFSRTSRRNLLRRLASINRSAFKAFKGRMIFVTLTYPGEYPDDPELCKRHLNALRKRLQREYEPFAAFWRLGIQRRGAWHFHLLLFVGPSIGSIGELRRFISSSWYEITGKV